MVKYKDKIEVSVQELDDFEKENDLILLDEYKNFLLEGGAGDLSEDFQTFYTVNGFVFVTEFYAINRVGSSDLEDCLTDYRERTWQDEKRTLRFPKECIPIGGNDTDDYICLGLEGEYKGKVYFWSIDGDMPEMECENFYSAFLLAESLSDFLGQLTSFKK